MVSLLPGSPSGNVGSLSGLGFDGCAPKLPWARLGGDSADSVSWGRFAGGPGTNPVDAEFIDATLEEQRASSVPDPMLLIERIIGSRLDPALSGRIHELEHRGAVDVLVVAPAEVARRRFRASTRGGAELAIALPRDQHLFDGAVLLLDADRALVVRLDEQRWLRLEPAGIAEALELGFQAGNLHWRVRFEGEGLLVALEAPVEDYLRRLEPLLSGRRIAHAVVSGPEGLS